MPTLSNDIIPEIEAKFSLLMPIVTQMKYLTSFFTQYLISNAIIPSGMFEEKFFETGASIDSDIYSWVFEDDIAETANKYNMMIERNKVPGISIAKTLLPYLMTSDFDYINLNQREMFNLVGICYREIHRVLHLYCPEYNVVEGDDPFSPSGNTRVRCDGSKEILFNNAYLLTMDIIGSTDSPQTNEMKNIILNLLSDFRNKNMFHETSGNDAYFVCADEPSVLLDVADSIRIEGERLKIPDTRFGGTRKGLSFGAIKVIIFSDSKIAIIDAHIPNIIPAAFSILSAIDEFGGTDDLKNSLISVSSSGKRSVRANF